MMQRQYATVSGATDDRQLLSRDGYIYVGSTLDAS